MPDNVFEVFMGQHPPVLDAVFAGGVDALSASGIALISALWLVLPSTLLVAQLRNEVARLALFGARVALTGAIAGAAHEHAALDYGIRHQVDAALMHVSFRPATKAGAGGLVRAFRYDGLARALIRTRSGVAQHAAGTSTV